MYVLQVASQNYVVEAFNLLGETSVSVCQCVSVCEVLAGSMYQHGLGVAEDMEAAVEHYKQGAELGKENLHVYIHTHTHTHMHTACR